MDKPDVLLPILAGTAIFVVLSVFINILIYLFRQKRKHHRQEVALLKQAYEQSILQAQVEVQESTYRHIANELHDNVGQLLSTTKMLMGVTKLQLGQAPDTLSTASATLSKAIEELRLLSRSLDREWLEQFNFLDNLHNEVERINAGDAIKAAVECSTAISMNPEQQIILFRIVQEAIQNAIRHAQPSQINVQISNSQALEVKVINDGKPLPAEFSGMGTRNMRHRTRLFGGDIQWLSDQGKTTVAIRLPLNPHYEN